MKDGKSMRYSEYRQRRRKRLKQMVRAFLFLKRHAGQFAIASGLIVILAVLPAAYLLLRPARAAAKTPADSTHAQDIRAAQDTEKAEAVQTGLSGRETDPESLTGEERPDAGGRGSMTPAGEAGADPGTENCAAPHIRQPVHLSDVYAVEGSIVIFKCFYPDASGYIWETFDETDQEWKKVAETDTARQSDELGREASAFITTAEKKNDGLKVRCRAVINGNGADTGPDPAGELPEETAVLHVLHETITGISAQDFTAEAGQYIEAGQIPVLVTYQDGSTETVTGLNGLSFADREESMEETTSVSGNVIETQTTVIRSHEYVLMEAGETQKNVRYKNGDTSIDVPVQLCGQDLTPPMISDLTIDEFEISSQDKPVPVTVRIRASDDITAEKGLKYAFLPEDREPEETDWTADASFTVQITQNGTWRAYCMDESGNTAVKETEIIAVDNKAPLLSLQLKVPQEWCRENEILVKSSDALSVEYRYICTSTGEDSGWITQGRYGIKNNGTWTVQAKDAAGNISEEEISIENIDSQPPVIRSIRVKEEKEGDTAINED